MLHQFPSLSSIPGRTTSAGEGETEAVEIATMEGEVGGEVVVVAGEVVAVDGGTEEEKEEGVIGVVAMGIEGIEVSKAE